MIFTAFAVLVLRQWAVFALISGACGNIRATALASRCERIFCIDLCVASMAKFN